MQVVKSNVESKVEIFKMTRNSEQVSSLADGSELELTGNYLLYNDTNARGELNEVFAFTTKDGKCYSTVSETFKREVMDILSLGVNNIVIAKTSGQTKNGRTYISCILVDATE